MTLSWKYILSIFFLLSSLGCSSLLESVVSPPRTHEEVLAQEFNKRFTPAELKEDLDVLLKTLESVHPNPYAYAPKSALEQEVQHIRQSLVQSLTRIEFYLKAAPLVASISEGHTNLWPPYEEFNDFVIRGGHVFPLDLEFNAANVIVTANYSSDSLVLVGSELIALNRIPMDEIASRLINLRGGERLEWRRQVLSGNFRRLLWMTYGIHDTITVELRNPFGIRLTRQVSAVTASDLRQRREVLQKDEQSVAYTYRAVPDLSTGIIDLRSFTDLSKFESFLKETFKHVQKDTIRNLIIDLRRNGGGNSALGDLLLGYLTDQPYAQFSRMELKVSRELKTYYKGFLPWIIRWLPVQYAHPYGRRIWNTPEGDMAVFDIPRTAPEEDPLRFKGEVFVVIGPRTFSSAVAFASTIKDFKLGVLVGEETGGLATSFGDVLPFDLTNTRIQVGISHKRFVRPSGEDDGRGVLPDCEVRQSAEDMSSGVDTVMEFTMNLIKGKKERAKLHDGLSMLSRDIYR